MKKIIGFIAVLLGSILMIAAIFLPFASATGDYREYLENNPDMSYAGDVQMKNADAADISLFEFGKIYLDATANPITQPLAVICLALLSVFALFVVLTTLFSILRKAIPVIVFGILSAGLFSTLKWDFGDRGVINTNYDWGIAQYFLYIGAAVAVVGAIVLLAAKISEKKANAGKEISAQ